MLILHIRENQLIFDSMDNLLSHKQEFIDTADRFSCIIECNGENVVVFGNPEQLFKVIHELSRKYDIELL